MSERPTIAIDASRVSVAHLTGTETYTFELLKAMSELEDSIDAELYYNAKSAPDALLGFGNAVCIPFPRLWTHVRLAIELQRRRPKLLFVPAHVVPVVHPPSVVTIHDLGFLHVPELHTPEQVRMLDWTTRWNARVAKRIIAISQFTKDDLIARYGTLSEKIEVVYHGISPIFEPSTPEQVARVRSQYGLPNTYVLAVGTVQPRKNYARLATAIRQLNDSGIEASLVVAGKSGWRALEVETEVKQAGIPVHWLGYVPEFDLPALYGGAAVTCQPSLFEGFGMPAIEAMASGSPLVAASSGALPEICGTAAFLVDPNNVNALANGLKEFITRSELRSDYVARGIVKAARFSWQTCARETLDVLRTAAA